MSTSRRTLRTYCYCSVHLRSLARAERGHDTCDRAAGKGTGRVLFPSIALPCTPRAIVARRKKKKTRVKSCEMTNQPWTDSSQIRMPKYCMVKKFINFRVVHFVIALART
ncbi:hypothetical protein PUN28_009685 [Cardiocondyla obscurior]|uniref:Secreted protein n=1 Tax=Cardiocondyla obscurior TaxID=286306 RepID=A0AAW2FZ53_9HYME